MGHTTRYVAQTTEVEIAWYVLGGEKWVWARVERVRIFPGKKRWVTRLFFSTDGLLARVEALRVLFPKAYRGYMNLKNRRLLDGLVYPLGEVLYVNRAGSVAVVHVDTGRGVESGLATSWGFFPVRCGERTSGSSCLRKLRIYLDPSSPRLKERLIAKALGRWF